MEYLIRGGRYASCVHTGGLSCFNKMFNKTVILNVATALDPLSVIIISLIFSLNCSEHADHYTPARVGAWVGGVVGWEGAGCATTVKHYLPSYVVNNKKPFQLKAIRPLPIDPMMQ